MGQLELDVQIDEEVFQPGESNGTVIRLSLTVALGGFLFGYDSAVKAIGDRFSTSSAVLGFTVSSALLGAAAGALAAGRVADQYGRLRAMWVAAALFLVSAVGSALASSLVILVVFRVIGGVAVRHRFGHRADLHRRDRAGEDPWQARLPAAARHRQRDIPGAAGPSTGLRRPPAGPRRISGWVWRPGSGCSWRWRSPQWCTADWR
jgi:hypothetical protein